MMKRLTAVLLALLMMCQCAFAVEAHSLSEKISLQMGDGSGMKGSFTLSAEGDAEWAQKIAAVAGNDFQIRCIRSGEGYLLEIYAAEGDDKHALTTVYITDGGATLKSELLPDMEVSFPVDAVIIDLITGYAGSNPTWYGAALNVGGVHDDVWASEWQTVLEPYYTNLEVWMNSYAAAPVVTTENGHTVMTLRYEIPAKAIPEMMISIVEKVLNDQTLMALVTAQMTDEQKALYLSPDMLYHYQNIIRALPFEGSLVIERKMTTMGDVLYSSITLPLAFGGNGWKSLRIEDAMGAYTFTLVTEDGEAVLAMTAPEKTDAGDKRIVTYRNIPYELSEENKAVSLRAVVVTSYETRTDEDTRGHEITGFDITVEEDLSHLAADAPERAFYEKVDTTALAFTLHLHSKNANTSPTTAALDFTYKAGGSSVTFSGQLKTTSPWMAGVYKPGAADALADMAEDELHALMTMFAVNAVEALDGK